MNYANIFAIKSNSPTIFFSYFPNSPAFYFPNLLSTPEIHLHKFLSSPKIHPPPSMSTYFASPGFISSQKKCRILIFLHFSR